MHRQRKGLALILVLIVVAMLALSAYTFTGLMMAENESAVLHGQQLQARAAVDSGVSQIGYFLEQDELTRDDLGGTYFNPDLFQAQLVKDHTEPRGRARFAALAPQLSDDGYYGGMRFGLEDESARMNLNALDLEVPDIVGDTSDLSNDALGALGDAAGIAGDQPGGGSPGGGSPGGDGGSGGGVPGGDNGGDDDDEGSGPDEIEEPEVDKSGRAMLMQLPGMTLDMADAILDWIDEDDDPREYGAEFDYYGGLANPYAPKNGPLETLEELLLVRDVTPELLFGRDLNRNGLIDLHEQDIILPDDMGDGALDRGWAAYLTLFSSEKNVTADGIARIDLNGEDLQLLYDELSAVLDPGWATFIIAYRQFGPYQEPEEDEEEDDRDEGGDNGGRGGGGGGGGGGGNDDDEEQLERVRAGNQPLDFSKAGRFPLTQVLDLIGVDVRAELDGEEDPVIIESPFPEEPATMSTYLPRLMDNCTVVPDPIIPGRININQAPFFCTDDHSGNDGTNRGFDHQ